MMETTPGQVSSLQDHSANSHARTRGYHDSRGTKVAFWISHERDDTVLQYVKGKFGRCIVEQHQVDALSPEFPTERTHERHEDLLAGGRRGRCFQQHRHIDIAVLTRPTGGVRPEQQGRRDLTR